MRVDVTSILPGDSGFSEIVDFIASNPSPEEMIHFKPSEYLDRRLHYLLDQNRLERITVEELAELEKFIQINHLLNTLKIRARQKLTC